MRDEPTPGGLRALAMLIRVGYRAAPGLYVARSLMAVAGFTAPVLAGFALRALIDGVLAHDRGEALAGALLGGLALAGTLAASLGASLTMFPQRERLFTYTDRRLMELTAAIPGLDPVERPAYRDRLEQLRDNRWRLWQARHLLDLAVTAAPARELRVFGSAGLVLDLHRQTTRERDRVLAAASARRSLLALAGFGLIGAGYAAALLLSVQAAAQGRLSAGDVALVMSLAGSAIGGLSALAGDSPSSSRACTLRACWRGSPASPWLPPAPRRSGWRTRRPSRSG